MLKRIKGMIVLGAAAAIAAVGCAQAPTSQGLQGEALAMMGPGYQTLEAEGQAQGKVPHALAEKLGLTDAQKQELKAIAEKYHGQFKGDHQADHAQLKALLLAEKVDGPALKAWLASRLQSFAGKAPTRAAMLGEMRAVLTDAQRAQLAEILSQPHPQARQHFQGMQQHMRARMLADLNLTAEQQAAFDALHAKFQALHQSDARDRMREAFATFVRTGDTAALAAAHPGADKLPVDELVAVATSLDLAQRSKLVAKVEKFQGFMKHRMHR